MAKALKSRKPGKRSSFIIPKFQKSPFFVNRRQHPNELQYLHPFPFPINPFWVYDPFPDDYLAHYGTCQDNYPSYNFQNNKLNVHVYFSSSVDKATAFVGKNFIVETPQDDNAAGNLSFDSISPNGLLDSHCVFTSQKNWDQLLSPSPDTGFMLHLYGLDIFLLRPDISFIPGIRDVNGFHLDGDYSGSLAGGTYDNWFYLIG